MSMTKLPTASQLRAARAVLDLDLRTTSELIGISPHSLSRYERGQGRPTVERLTRIHDAYARYGVSFLDIEDQLAVTFRG